MIFRVREMLKQLGYPDTPVRTAYGFRYSPAALPTAIAERELQFWYRQHVDLFYADAFLGVDTTRNGSVGYDSPAFLEPGMIRLLVSPQVRLIHLEALPRPKDPRASGQPDWPALFTLAGLDLNQFRSVQPEAVPPIAADTRAAWIGNGPGSSAEVRVEAASWGNRVVYFSAARAKNEASPAVGSVYGLWAAVGFVILAFVTPPLLAWNNLRKGRADRTGAAAIAWVIFITWAIPWSIGAEHVAAPWEFLVLIQGVLEIGAYTLLAYWSYLAVEPYARKLWPDSLISWTRVRSGRVNDPLVASHVLVGIAATCVWHLFGGPAIAKMAGATAEVPWPDAIQELHNGAYPVIHFSRFASAGISVLLNCLVVVVVLRILLRKIWIADTVFAVTLGAGFLPMYFGDGPLVGYVMIGHTIALSAILLWLVRRFGLLAGAAGLLTFYLSHVPYVPGTWFAARTLPVLLAPAAFAAWALWVIVRSQKQTTTDSIA
jgi:hypothetical protein